ncbi:helix-turn-helix domain-containing protein, partial [Streptomyces sp. NPDC001215]
MTDTDPVLRALAHPVRLRMLSLMWPGPMSAAELARELDISHALASQHLRRLDTVGLVELEHPLSAPAESPSTSSTRPSGRPPPSSSSTGTPR